MKNLLVMNSKLGLFWNEKFKTKEKVIQMMYVVDGGDVRWILVSESWFSDKALLLGILSVWAL